MIQQLIHVSHDSGNPVVGAVMRCFDCGKLYATVKGQVQQPRWLRERELAELEQKEMAQKQKAALEDRAKKGPEPDMRWR